MTDKQQALVLAIVVVVGIALILGFTYAELRSMCTDAHGTMQGLSCR